MKGSEQTLKEVTRDKREERGIQEKKRGQKGCEQGVEYMEKQTKGKRAKGDEQGGKECEDGASLGSNRMLRGVQGRERAVQY